MTDAMFLVLLVTLVLLTWWLVSEIRGLKKSVEELRTVIADPGAEEMKDAIKKAVLDEDVKDAIKDAMLNALEEHDDPYPLPPQDYPGQGGLEAYEERLKDWHERHGR
jgi:hypothetical protein